MEEIVKEIEDATILIEEVRDGVAEIVKDSADISHSLEILEVRVNFLFFVWRSDVFQYKIGREHIRLAIQVWTTPFHRDAMDLKWTLNSLALRFDIQ